MYLQISLLVLGAAVSLFAVLGAMRPIRQTSCF